MISNSPVYAYLNVYKNISNSSEENFSVTFYKLQRHFCPISQINLTRVKCILLPFFCLNDMNATTKTGVSFHSISEYIMQIYLPIPQPVRYSQVVGLIYQIFFL